MKKALLIVAFLMVYEATLACEFCGCGVGNFYLGILPQFHRQFVGIRYQAQWFDSHVGLHPSLATSEYFQTTEVWARFYPTSRLQILTLIPYHFNEQTSTSGKVYLNGLGDIPVLANYNVYSTIKEDPLRPLKHSVWMGGGIKLPTGKYKFVESPDAGANPNFQLGTGSIDFMLNTLYTLRYNKWGINADATYKINTYNPSNYRFGNKLMGSVSAVFIQQIQKVGVMPNAGIYSEQSAKNYSGDIVISDTGGTASFITGGVETYWKKLSAGFNYRRPVIQNLANGRIVAHDRLMVHVTFLF